MPAAVRAWTNAVQERGARAVTRHRHEEWAPDGELRLTEDVVRTDVRTSRRNGGVEETQGSPRPRINAAEGAEGEGRDIVEPAPIKLGSLPEAPKSS